MKKQLIDFYLDWVNNFISSNGMASHYDMDNDEVCTLIDIGRKYHEEKVELLKGNIAHKKAIADAAETSFITDRAEIGNEFHGDGCGYRTRD